jgi:hypothetical protein
LKVLVVDNFVPNPEEVRASALITGFGTWKPTNTIIGYDTYDGVNINGKHSVLVKALTEALGCPIYPESMIFRVTGEKTEPATIHSDRMFGTHSCIVYLSHEQDKSGTGFYQHLRTESCEMPPLESIIDTPEFGRLKYEMREATEEYWKEVHFVEGKFNRALIFSAPLYHSRIPRLCKGTTAEDSRMIWITHFNVGGECRV